jgi:diaminohydroxyphosphoribosylaminopyrimidine deaminase/5-amino-6-(5-phosphoribosylamino)uracil reductase
MTNPNNKKSDSFHSRWMERALFLAEKGRFTTSPNPMVGACLVKNGKLVGEGYHKIYGGDHAEIAALKQAGKKAKGASLYVTLEPCATWGKTPPCAAALLEAGVREVVIGSLDPNPKNRKKGVAALRQSGIRVTSGVLDAAVKKQNEAFFKFVTERMPFVTLKMAQSLDGKIATYTGHSRWISSKPAREFVHQLRAEQDAVLVGTQTLKADDPMLSPRRGNFERREGKPWRIALDPRFEISPRARIFNGDQLTVIAVSDKITLTKRFQNQKMASCMVLPVAEHKGRLQLPDLLRKLASLGVAKILVEGGGELAWSLVKENLVDKFYWIIAPKIIGGRSAKTSVEGDGVKLASQAFQGSFAAVRPLGEDLLLEGNIA